MVFLVEQSQDKLLHAGIVQIGLHRQSLFPPRFLPSTNVRHSTRTHQSMDLPFSDGPTMSPSETVRLKAAGGVQSATPPDAHAAWKHLGGNMPGAYQRQREKRASRLQAFLVPVGIIHRTGYRRGKLLREARDIVGVNS